MRTVGWVLWAALVAAIVAVALELGLRLMLGFGTPVLYDNTYAMGFRPLPNQDIHRVGRKRVRFNNLALRATRDWPARRSGELRLLYLGDSVTYGGGYVDDRDTFAETSADVVRRRIGRDVLVGNGAVNGWGPKNIRGLVDRHGFFGSDVVVIVAQQADLGRDLSHMAETPFWNHPPRFAIEELVSSYIAYRINIRRFDEKERFVPAAERDSFCRGNVEQLVAIGRLARESGARVLMVWHPTRDALADPAAEPYREVFLDACRRAGLPALDLLPVVRGDPRPAGLYVDPVHLGARGHALYGRVLGGAVADLVRGPS